MGTPTDDPYQQQWNLKPRIEALQAEAKGTRRDLADRYKTDETRLGVERDRVARDQYSAEQTAKSADIQVQRETKDAAAEAKKAEEFDALAAKEERSGDRSGAEESREIAEVARVKQETHLARSRQATLDAAERREQAATHGRRVTELEVEREGLRTQAMKSEAELDKIEQQAKLLEDARRKYAEADLAGAGNPQQASAALLEAERLEAEAAAIDVNRGTIRQSIPEFPDVTPGIDLAPPPLPEGAQSDVSVNEDPLGIDDDFAAASSSPDTTSYSDDAISTETFAAPTETIPTPTDTIGTDTIGTDTIGTDTFTAATDDSYAAPVADVTFDVAAESVDSFDA